MDRQTENAKATPDVGRAADHAYRAIRDDILSGRRPGGEWLREEDLAAEIGVSRTPVREALRLLGAEGLVQHERNRGVMVQSWSVADVDEIFSLRSLLEPWGCRMAAELGQADITALSTLADDMDAAVSTADPDLDRLTTLNNRFHLMILQSAGNSRLVGVVASVVQVPLVWRTFSHYSPGALRRSLAHHHELVEAIAAGDGDWAESVMRSHVRAAWNSIRPDAEERAQA